MITQRRPASRIAASRASWSASWKPGEYNVPPFVGDKSIKFDGTDDVITTSADSTLATKTYSFWAKSTKTTAGGVFDHGDINHGAFFLNFSNGRPLVYLANGWFRYWEDVSSQDDGTWHHYLVLLHTNINNTKLFVDGVEQSVNETNTSSGSALAYTTGIRIGRGGGFYFDGSLDEFAIFDGDQSALADELYNNGQPKNLSSYSTLDHWFRMGEGKLDGKSDGDENLLFDQGPNGGLGSELVTNGDLSTWTDTDTIATWNHKDSNNNSGGGVISQVGSGEGSGGTGLGSANFFTASATTMRLTSGVVSEAGKSYQLEIEVSRYVQGIIRVQGAVAQDFGASDIVNGKIVKLFTAASATYIRVQGSDACDFTIDNVSLKEVQNVGTINGPAIQADGGTELVTNGDLSNGTTGWENPSGGAMTSSVVSGKLRLTSSSAYKYVFQSFTTRVGGVYSFTVDATKGTSPNYDAYLGTGQNGATLFNSGSLGFADSQGDTRTITGTFTATSTTTFLNLRSRNQDSLTDAFTDFDNISVKEVTESVPKQTQNLPSGASKKSMSFDGTDDFAIVPYQLPTNTFTVSVWFKITEDALTSASTYIWDARDASYTTANIFLPVKHSATEYKLRWWNDGTHRINNATIYPIGRWQHVVLVKDGTTGTMYVDGEKLDSATSFSNTTNGTEINLGRRYAATFAYLKGGIDEFAAWDTVLDGDAVKALYNAGQPTPVTTKTGAYDIYRDNLKAYYKMGDASDPAADGTSNLLFDQTNPGVGSENVVNGTFDDSTGWTESGVAGTFTIADGKATKTVGTYANLHTTFSSALVSGKLYKITFDVSPDGAGNTTYAVGFIGGGDPTSSYETRNGTSTVFLTATTAHVVLRILPGGSAIGGSIDNVSVREVNGHTATITGATIQTEAPKAIYALPPVANTKSLNFSTDDYLQTQVDATAQPNGESRYYSWWSKSSQTSVQTVFSHGGWHVGGFLFNSANSPLLYMASNVYQYWADNGAQDDGNWHHWVVKIKYNDITGCELWCDGVKQTKTSNVNSGSMNPYTTGIQIGAASASNSYFNGSLDEFSIHEDLDEEAIRALFNRGRPIDISSGHGAYDLSDKALHWWRMGDATSPAADGTNDIVFQGLEFEGSEMFPTNASSSDWASLNKMTWDGTKLSYAGTGGEQAYAQYTFTLPVGQTFRLNVDVTNDGTGNFFARIGDGNNALAISNVTTGSYELVHTVTESGANNTLFFIVNGGFSGTISNISLNRIRGQYKDANLLRSDAYDSGRWVAYTANTFSNPSPTAVRMTRTGAGDGASHQAGYTTTSNNRLLTENQVAGQVYCLTFDFETDDPSGRARFYPGTGGSYYMFPAGSGSFTYSYVALSQSGVLSADSIGVGKYAQWSNIKVQKLIGPAVMTNMTTSDIQTDTPY